MTNPEPRPDPSPHRGWTRPLLVAIATAAAVTACSYLLPGDYSATGVGLVFLAVTYLVVLRRDDDAEVRHCGLSLGGLLEREPLRARRLLVDLGKSAAWAVGIALIVLPPFWVGFYYWYRPDSAFAAVALPAVGAEVMGQLLVIALPEEAFYRGYLQTRLDDAWTPRLRVLGARLGPGVLVTSVLFAVSHMATDFHPGRLAVFFPSLLFGWLRARTGTIGAAVLLHALCNLFASYLTSSYGLGN